LNLLAYSLQISMTFLADRGRNIILLWDVTSCSWIDKYWHFRDKKIFRDVMPCALVDMCSHFRENYLKDGGNRYLQDDTHLPDYVVTTYDSNLCSQHHEILQNIIF
jgi:hypothetical protein